MRKTLLLIGILCGMGCVYAQTAGEHFDVSHYELHVWDFDFTNHTIQGEAFIDLVVTAPTDTFVLELKSLTVTDAATDSYGVSGFSQEGDFLTIVIDETADVGETLTLDVRYGGNTFSESWGGVEWWGTDYVYNLGVGFDSQPHNLGKTWFPCVDNFTDKATYSLYFTVTNDKKAICGGNLVNTINNGDGTSTWQWETPQEIATYHISFAVGNYELWEDVYHGVERDIPVQVYAKPAQMGNVPGTFVNGSVYSFLLVVSDGIETASAMCVVDRAFANLHLSGQSTGGVAIGKFSAATYGNPLFECEFPAVFGGGINKGAVEIVNITTINSNFKVYRTGEYPRIIRFGNVVFLEGCLSPSKSLTMSSTSNQYTMITIPAGYRPSREMIFVCHGSTLCLWLLRINTSGECIFERYRKGDAYATPASGELAAVLRRMDIA